MYRLLVFTLALFVVGSVGNSDFSSIFDRSAVIQALGEYANGINAVGKLSPTTCAGSPVGDVTAAMTDLIYSSFATSKVKYFRINGPPIVNLNFTLGGTFIGFTGAPVNNRTTLLNGIVQILSGAWMHLFTQPTRHIYSTPTVDFKINDPEFDRPTATVVLEHENSGFFCPNGPSGARVFQVIYSTFTHKFCYENNPGHDNDGWKICGFNEQFNGAFTQDGALFQQSIPVV
jgi:hypothetical protein